ncbi:MAG: DUF362 domain-containing protein [Myxococcales bacterium]|nr:DUF362 domain-containing protein [Myxococcales bacterium]
MGPFRPAALEHKSHGPNRRRRIGNLERGARSPQPKPQGSLAGRAGRRHLRRDAPRRRRRRCGSREGREATEPRRVAARGLRALRGAGPGGQGREARLAAGEPALPQARRREGDAHEGADGVHRGAGSRQGRGPLRAQRRQGLRQAQRHRQREHGHQQGARDSLFGGAHRRWRAGAEHHRLGAIPKLPPGHARQRSQRPRRREDSGAPQRRRHHAGAHDPRHRRPHEFVRVLTEATAVINFSLVKDHSICGYTGAMKNMTHGCTVNPHDFHVHHASPQIALLYAQDVIKSRVRLHITDAFKVMAHGGPLWKQPQYVSSYESIFVATDPVAMDTLGWEIVEARRAEKKLRSLTKEGREPAYLKAAADLGLGVYERAQIKLQEFKLS